MCRVVDEPQSSVIATCWKHWHLAFADVTVQRHNSGLWERAFAFSRACWSNFNTMGSFTALPSFTMSPAELYYQVCRCNFCLCETENNGLPFTPPLLPSNFHQLRGLIVPRMASTVLSFSTSMEPEQTKKMAWRASPCRRRYSPGAQKEVLMCSDNERKQPRLAEANSDSSRISLLRCMVMSDRSSSGKSFSSWGDNGREDTWGEEAGKRGKEPWQV